MSVKYCFIHAGTPKTGSSAIQYALTHSHDQLLAKGYNFPDLTAKFHRILQGHPTGGNASGVGVALRRGDPEQALSLVRPFAAQPNHLILSSEGLFSAPPRQLKMFCEGLRHLGFEPRCLVFFRPQTEVMVSAYLQLIKINSDRTTSGLDEFARRQDYQGRRNWFQCAHALENAFGPDNVTVEWYPRLRSHGGVIKAAFEWLNVSPPVIEVPQINPTPGREALMILSRLNARGLGGKKFADAFLARADAEGLLENKVLLGSETRQFVHQATLASNTQLLRRYLPTLSPEEELVLPDTKEPALIDPDTLWRLTEIASKVLKAHRIDPALVDESLRPLASREPQQ